MARRRYLKDGLVSLEKSTSHGKHSLLLVLVLCFAVILLWLRLLFSGRLASVALLIEVFVFLAFWDLSALAGLFIIVFVLLADWKARVGLGVVVFNVLLADWKAFASLLIVVFDVFFADWLRLSGYCDTVETDQHK